MALVVSIPLFAGLVIFQSAIMSRMQMLQGTADLVLLFLIAWAIQNQVQNSWQWAVVAGLIGSMATALPFGTLLIIYLIVTRLGLIIKTRVWKAPLLAMLATTFIGTIAHYFVSYLAVTTKGIFLPPLQVIELVVLPGILLNIILAIPVYVLVRDLANWLYPEELEV
jgi:cell shape-determining protein MreD